MDERSDLAVSILKWKTHFRPAERDSAEGEDLGTATTGRKRKSIHNERRDPPHGRL
jgi:hypothetical protein